MAQQGSPNPHKAEVVSLWQHQAKRDVSALSEMRGYWESLRCGRLVPLRSEIDPREIAGALEYGFIIERLQPGAIRFRLAGMHLNDLMGMEVNGMPLRSFISPESRTRFSAMLERVFTQPEIHEYILSSDDMNVTPLRARLLILPLKSDAGQINRAIGCLVSEGVVGISPRRFKVLETRVTSLLNGEQTREIASDTYTQAPSPRVAAFAEAQEGFTSEPRPALRLVVSDDADS
ncbi:MAG: PAS domain-containing protein [Litoreibacter sp.]|uniref:PAS domain-containing protein n=1 Tax=Litoreibacter sp. TaxID=1969459 RepID=UPI0032988D76